jgi:hypothetical protein
MFKGKSGLQRTITAAFAALVLTTTFVGAAVAPAQAAPLSVRA